MRAGQLQQHGSKERALQSALFAVQAAGGGTEAARAEQIGMRWALGAWGVGPSAWTIATSAAVAAQLDTKLASAEPLQPLVHGYALHANRGRASTVLAVYSERSLWEALAWCVLAAPLGLGRLAPTPLSDAGARTWFWKIVREHRRAAVAALNDLDHSNMEARIQLGWRVRDAMSGFDLSWQGYSRHHLARIAKAVGPYRLARVIRRAIDAPTGLNGMPDVCAIMEPVLTQDADTQLVADEEDEARVLLLEVKTTDRLSTAQKSWLEFASTNGFECVVLTIATAR